MRTRALTGGLIVGMIGLACGLAPQARADDDRVEARTAAACTPAGSVRLRLRADDEDLRIDVRARVPARRTARPERWRVIVVHERRTVLRRAQPLPRTGVITLRTFVAAFPGSNTVRVRLYGPRGQACSVAATVLLPVEADRD